MRLNMEAQLRAGADVLTDGEQRRDSYASFVGGLLDNCQLIPLSDLAAIVDDPAKFEMELRALDVPRHGCQASGGLRQTWQEQAAGRPRDGIRKDLHRQADKNCAARPVPPYAKRCGWTALPSVLMKHERKWAEDVVRVLREELHFLLASGAALVQFDEPVLTEVVFGGASRKRSFMCGALSERLDTSMELDFAVSLMNELVRDLPPERTGMHICRGNWSADESVALSGDYAPLIDTLNRVNVGVLFLELATGRAGDSAVLRSLDEDKRIRGGRRQPETRLGGAGRGGRPANSRRHRPVWPGTRTANA